MNSWANTTPDAHPILLSTNNLLSNKSSDSFQMKYLKITYSFIAYLYSIHWKLSIFKEKNDAFVL